MQDTYTIKDLRKRYDCAASTIYRNMITKGFPRGGAGIGSRNKISGAAIFKWELKYMPWLHPDVEVTERMDEEVKWKIVEARRDMEKLKKVKPVAEKKSDPPAKARHGKKAVARRKR